MVCMRALQEEFNLILEQFDVQNKLTILEKLMEQQPEGSFGVPLSDIRPATAMRVLNCKKKQEECERLQAWLKQLERCAPLDRCTVTNLTSPFFSPSTRF